jgi:hypothetical protein
VYSLEVESYELDGEVICGERRTRRGVRSGCDSSRTGDSRVSPRLDRAIGFLGEVHVVGCQLVRYCCRGRLARHV